jgi:hypothetical protein
LLARRTFASWCHDTHVPLKVQAELMGHSPEVSIGVYTKVMDGATVSAIEQLGRRWTQAVDASSVSI